MMTWAKVLLSMPMNINFLWGSGSMAIINGVEVECGGHGREGSGGGGDERDGGKRGERKIISCLAIEK